MPTVMLRTPPRNAAAAARFCASQVKITADGLEAVVDLSGGDMRKAVTAMQSASQFYAGVEVGLVGSSARQSAGPPPARSSGFVRLCVPPSVNFVGKRPPPPLLGGWHLPFVRVAPRPLLRWRATRCQVKVDLVWFDGLCDGWSAL